VKIEVLQFAERTNKISLSELTPLHTSQGEVLRETQDVTGVFDQFCPSEIPRLRGAELQSNSISRGNVFFEHVGWTKQKNGYISCFLLFIT